jgi:hydroxyacylglutathione hydrolase
MIRNSGEFRRLYLMFQRFFDEGLAQASFLIACERTREAVVVDPRRDIDIYTSAARQLGVTLACAIETHVHADFVSGARELAALGVRTVTGPGAAPDFPHHAAVDGEDIRVGDVRLQVLHTPGHTPEHISLVVHERGAPVRVLTGDTLFVGAVGRPDLLGADLMRQLASDLYQSLYGTLLSLGDEVEVHPGHGAGSLCGAGIGQAPHSTIGQERRFNPMLQHRSREAFAAAVLDDLPPTPPYFPRVKRINKAGPAVLGLAGGVPAPPPLAPVDAFSIARDGGVIIDVRPGDLFAAAHPSGALNIGFGARVAYWAGWLVAPGERIVLVTGGDREALEVRRQLLRVGLDDVAGVVAGGFEAWRAAGLPISPLELISARELQERRAARGGLTIVDVRSPHEYASGHVEEAINIPVGELRERASSLPPDVPVATICEGGFRSSLAASVLARAGLRSVSNVSGGMTAYRTLEMTS